MHRLRRKLFSQNFLNNRRLVHSLVRNSSIGEHDLVLEIGPGSGIITETLLTKAHHVLAVEIDRHWTSHLKLRFTNSPNLTLYQKDFLDFSLPRLPYKVFSNLPFSIEGQIIRKLLNSTNPPSDSYLVIDRKLGYRLIKPSRPNLFSITYQPWFDFSIQYYFQRTDFTPRPHADAIMIRIKQKEEAMLPIDTISRYKAFILHGFGQGQSVLQNLGRYYPKNIVLKHLHRLGIPKSAKPSHITLNQWLKLFQLLNA